jgi:hypothetical protein
MEHLVIKDKDMIKEYGIVGLNVIDLLAQNGCDNTNEDYTGGEIFIENDWIKDAKPTQFFTEKEITQLNDIKDLLNKEQEITFEII